MLKFMSLSSGSCGNCYFLGWQPDEQTPLRGILIDAGVSLRALKRNLRLYGLGTDCFDAILVTHDHFDHIRHLGSFCSHLHKPVYASRTLHDALSRHFATRDAIVPCPWAAAPSAYGISWSRTMQPKPADSSSGSAARILC